MPKGYEAVSREPKFFKGDGGAFCALAVIASVLAVLNINFKQAAVNTAFACANILTPKIKIYSKAEIKKITTENSSKSNGINDIPITDSREEPSVEASSDIYATPKDILELAQAYTNEYSQKKHDGKIVEKTYDKTSATSVFKNITVRNTTSSHSINIEKSLNEKAKLNISDKSQPTVLIFHTHTTESYQMTNEGWYTRSYPTRHNEKNQNMVRVGDAICQELEKSGIGVIHDTEIHDLKYTGAYDNSRKTVEKILKENPTVQIVLDVHRDAIEQSDGTKIKPTFTYNGKKAAQLMIIAGCQDGKVKDFPNWEQNLTFALQLHEKTETMFPKMMRPILFSARKYNMDVVPCSVLLEFGSDSNTLAEAEYSGHLFGRALSAYIQEKAGE